MASMDERSIRPKVNWEFHNLEEHHIRNIEFLTTEKEECSSFPEPEPISKIQPEMRVYSRNIRGYNTIRWCDEPAEAIQRLHLSASSRLVFISHGFTGDIETSWMYDLKDAMLMQEEDKNTVAIVGWGGGSSNLLKILYYHKMLAYIGLSSRDPRNWLPKGYRQAAANTQAVGKWVQKFARAAKQQYGVYLYGVGFSLGAHVIGAAARTREDRSQKSELFDRITGLDPAGPGFEDCNLDKRIGPNDAKMVDMIHTCGNYLGTFIPRGTIDFYPHYGYEQPKSLLGKFKYFIVDHERAHEYYLYSMDHPEAFTTKQVLSGTPKKNTPVLETHVVRETAKMGYHADKYYKSGLYYVDVDDCLK